MSGQILREALEAMVEMPGVEGCALVEIEAGMVWHHAGHIEGIQTFAEAASDYWRLYQRLSRQFQDLGDLRASVMMHAYGRITLLPCGEGVLLVTLTRDKSGTDWTQVQLKAKDLAAIVDSL
ncbi:roadblock/LC7 domain-containing protein [Ottowia thiooxydans]|uniref:Regulator of Ras-like GTPase activity (Roadblock/LC7/MglB family) n=1 Tax=Ottowia thiooxydans TaxID=219182 RepID=A0ABV2QD58_9BURK